MTTKVTVEPAGHTVSVTIQEGPNRGTVEVLEPGSPARDYWVYSGRKIIINEETVAAK